MSDEPTEPASRLSEADTPTLKLAYEDLCKERDRLREARASITRQLGPLPISAGIAFGIVSGFSPKVQHEWLLFCALGAFAAMVGVSALYSGLQPYRQLRARAAKRWRERLESRYRSKAMLAEKLNLKTEDLLPEHDWYAAMIRLERRVYGELVETNRKGLPRRSKVDDLQHAFDLERTGLYTVQLLFVVVIVCLVLSRLV